MSLLDFMYYLTYFEYEKAKRCIFGGNYLLADHKQPATKNNEDGEGRETTAAFHPIFLSSLLNQQTFKRDYMHNKYQRKIDTEKEEAKYQNKRKEVNDEIIKYVKYWVNLIELQGYFQYIIGNEEERQTAQNLMELLEKCVASWDEKDNM